MSFPKYKKMQIGCKLKNSKYIGQEAGHEWPEACRSGEAY